MMTKAAPIQVRFAPSPTGPLHIGGVRTLLYNYLLAKQSGGKLILRIEDTDQKRSVPNAEKYILESLQWLGIIPDEGAITGGPRGPYRQSQRLDIYKQHITSLLSEGHAYYAFDTPEALEAMRIGLKEAKIANPRYNAVRMEMKNSLTMANEAVASWIAAGKPYVIRLKVPTKEVIRFYDGVRGWVKVDSATLDDKVLIKADGMPTYHFASVVDDYLMEITHVIRGEEWLPSTPIHLLLYRYFGWEAHMPQFFHLPLLLAPDGKGKLSKRHAHLYNCPVFPIAWQSEEIGFREAGYLPVALWNFLALLGWNPGTKQELFTQDELIEAFSLERLGKSAVHFDIAKAKWFNQQHIQRQDAAVWIDYFLTEAAQAGIQCSHQKALAICTLVQDRVTFPQDFWKEGSFFFFEPVSYDLTFVKNRWNTDTKAQLLSFAEGLTTLTSWDADHLKGLLAAGSMTALMPLLRMALTGSKAGPELLATMVCMGKDTIYKRIMTCLAHLDTAG